MRKRSAFILSMVNDQREYIGRLSQLFERKVENQLSRHLATKTRLRCESQRLFSRLNTGTQLSDILISIFILPADTLSKLTQIHSPRRKRRRNRQIPDHTDRTSVLA